MQIKIFKAETQRALALLLKGHAEPRDTLEKLSSAADKEDSAARRNSTALELAETARWDSVGYMNHAWGFLAGYAKNTMKVQLNPSLTTNMSGSSTDFSFFYQQRLDQDFSGRLAIGMESLNAKGTISGVDCNGVSDCNVNVTYLSLNPVIRLSYYRDQSDFWVGGGMNFLQALAKNSTAVKAEKIGTNLALSLSTGIDWNLHNGHFIPLQIEYAMFPGNSTIQVQQLIFRAGYGYSF